MTVFQYKLTSRAGPITVEDYRQLAKRAVPSMVWAYVDSGAEDLGTLNSEPRGIRTVVPAHEGPDREGCQGSQCRGGGRASLDADPVGADRLDRDLALDG